MHCELCEGSFFSESQSRVNGRGHPYTPFGQQQEL